MEYICSKRKALFPKHPDTTSKQTIMPAVKLSWKILPPGAHPFQAIIAHFNNLKLKYKKTTFDQQRLQEIYNLKPDIIYVGTDAFEGYVVFYFQQKKLAIFETPFTNNAIYIIEGDWERLSRYSKIELLRNHPDKVI
jgi:hypothetical protein